MTEPDAPQPTRGAEEPRDLAIAFGVTLVSLAWFSLTWTRTFDLLDEGHLMNQCARVLRGEIPLRDFSEAYGPGVYALNALVLGAFDGQILPVRVTIAVFKALTVGLTYLATRLLVPRSVALIGAGLAAVYWGRFAWNLNTPYGSVYTTFFCLLATYLVARKDPRTSPARALFWAGLAGGCAVLFKQSVALYFLYGLALSVWALDSLTRPRGEATPADRAALALWAVAAVVFLWPLRAYLSPFEYALHFLPLHVLMAVTAAWALQRASGISLRAALSPRMRWLVGGMATVPVLTLVFYLAVGGADSLLHNMFVFSLERENYVMPISLPAMPVGALAAAGGSFLTAMLLAMRGALPAAGAVFVVSFAAGAYGLSALPAGWALGELITTSADAMLGIEGTVVLAVAAALAWSVFAGSAERAFLPLFFFQAMMVLQVFPRAGFNVLLHAGETVPLLTYGLWRWSEMARPQTAVVRTAATALVAVVPLWLASPIVVQIWEQSRDSAAERALPWEETAGIALAPDRYEQRHVAALQPLIEYLRTTEPTDAPLLLLTREPMILYLSRRPPLFGPEQYPLHLVGIRMLPAERQAELLDPAALVAALEARPDTIVVTADDPLSQLYQQRLASLTDVVRREYRLDRRFGRYAVWRRDAPI